MNYKNYSAVVEFDEEANIFFGKVINTKDVITFEADNVKDLKKAFYDSVDDYLEFCKEINQEPEKPFSGNFMVRTSPEVHRQIFERAQQRGVSLNHFVEERLVLG